MPFGQLFRGDGLLVAAAVLVAPCDILPVAVKNLPKAVVIGGQLRVAVKNGDSVTA